MEHLINIPIECEEDNIGTDVDDNSIVLEFFYHRSVKEGSNVIVYIHDTAFHGKCVSSVQHTNCFAISVKICESFKLRMVEQVIRIENSSMTPEQWVGMYATEFPVR